MGTEEIYYNSKYQKKFYLWSCYQYQVTRSLIRTKVNQSSALWNLASLWKVPRFLTTSGVPRPSSGQIGSTVCQIGYPYLDPGSKSLDLEEPFVRNGNGHTLVLSDLFITFRIAYAELQDCLELHIFFSSIQFLHMVVLVLTYAYFNLRTIRTVSLVSLFLFSCSIVSLFHSFRFGFSPPLYLPRVVVFVRVWTATCNWTEQFEGASWFLVSSYLLLCRLPIWQT